uniref:FERM and PDZ domain containing 3 n=2 Tax=Leptobrachium leishanense TaxID=445787 RepID=A0A8C5PXH0_9ANUR
MVNFVGKTNLYGTDCTALLFGLSDMDEKTPATTLLVGPRHGISHVIDLKTNLTTVLFEFSQVTKVQLFRESLGVARVETSVTDTKSLVLLMDWPEATSFACLIAGYYRLLVDPKKGIFYRAAGHVPHPHIIKADYLSMPKVSHVPVSVRVQPTSTLTSENPTSKASSTTNSKDTKPISLCYLHLQDNEGRDVNQNVFAEETRPRTKSDPTPKGTSSEPSTSESVSATEVSRSRSFTMDIQVKQESSQFYCDSCKAKMKSRLEGTTLDFKCVNSCGSFTCRDNIVDLISLPPPEHKLGEEKEQIERKNEKEGTTRENEVREKVTLLPTEAPPPPGFGDNSSDEEEPKQRDRKRLGKGKEQETCTSTLGARYEELPVTLIDNVQTRTVRDHARDLDDALVSTLQALEALAASEDFPSPAPQPSTGLIVLAAITPESSLDSGHETNSSELTDVSEMVTAMKQHHNTAYFLAHHLNKETVLSQKDLPFRIQTCTAQAVLKSPYALRSRESSPVPKPSLEQHIVGNGSHSDSTSPLYNLAHSLNNGVTSPSKLMVSNLITIPVALKPPQIKNKTKQNLTSTEVSSEAIISTQNLTISNDGSPACNVTEKVKSPESPCGCLNSKEDPIPNKLRALSNEGHNVLHLSPTDDERLHAKACFARHLQGQHLVSKMVDKKETILQQMDSDAFLNIGTDIKELPEKNVQVTEVSTVTGSSAANMDSAKVTIKPDTNATHTQVPENFPAALHLGDCNVPVKPRARVSFRLRDLFSATFPTRMRRETDERQAQLRKVKQYEMEFLEELLKPQGKISTPNNEISHPLLPGHCSCQVRRSPLQKVPGMSREQRRSCDCKRIIRGLRVPVKPSIEQETRIKQGTGTPGLRLIRSASLESRGTEKMNLGLLTFSAQEETSLHYTKLEQKSEERGNRDDLSKLPPDKTQKKDENTLIRNRMPELDRKTEVIAPQQEEELFSIQSKSSEEAGAVSGEKCYAIRHCFTCRRCSSADDNNERDEISYSIPMQILPGMSLNAEASQVVNQTLHVLDTTVSRSNEENQTQEIDLRTATIEGSLAKVNALHGRAYSLPDGFQSVQLDTSELLTVLRHCLISPEAGEPIVDTVNLNQHKQELTLRFKEFRASCRRMAGADKSPQHMLTAVTSSFQVLCSLIETFIRLVFVVRSETQRQELLRKVEEVVRNYTFLLRAAEESSARTASQSLTVVGQLAKQTATVATAVSTFSRSFKTLMSK